MSKKTKQKAKDKKKSWTLARRELKKAKWIMTNRVTEPIENFN